MSKIPTVEVKLESKKERATKFKTFTGYFKKTFLKEKPKKESDVTSNL
jgi:hypothetical protein